MYYFQTPTPDYSGMSEEEIYNIGKNFEEKLAELLNEHKIYYQAFASFKLLEEGHKAIKEQLRIEEKEVV